MMQLSVMQITTTSSLEYTWQNLHSLFSFHWGLPNVLGFKFFSLMQAIPP
jgi:hypothetical protein